MKQIEYMKTTGGDFSLVLICQTFVSSLIVTFYFMYYIKELASSYLLLFCIDINCAA